MPRQARLDAPGTLHHVILRGIEKRRIVDDVADRKNFVKRLGVLSADTNTRIYAWALMTNHAHILLRSSEIGLSEFMRRFLTGYAISYNRRHRRWGHLFQNRYKSIVCFRLRRNNKKLMRLYLRYAEMKMYPLKN